MIKLRSEFGKIYYMTEEVSGTATSTSYTKIEIVSEDFMDVENYMEYASTYMNATNGSQPNIWTPYELRENEVIVYDSFLKNESYRFEIVKDEEDTKELVRALPVSIYKHKGKDCSNKGISSKYDEILLICEDGNIDVDLKNPPENLCELVERELFGRSADYVRPYRKANGVGWMAGGCVVYSPDSRFASDYPLCLHDRTESKEQYDLMFD